MQRLDGFFLAVSLSLGLAGCDNCGFPSVKSAGGVEVGSTYRLPFDPSEYYSCPPPGDAADSNVTAWNSPQPGTGEAEACHRAGTFNTSFHVKRQRYAVYVRRGLVTEIHKP